MKPVPLRLRVVTRGVVVRGDSHLPKAAYQFVRRNCADATHAVVASRGPCIVGFFRWFDDGFVVAAGTWVDKRERRNGLATRMWRRGLGQICGSLEVVVTSDAGAALVERITAEFPKRLHVERVRAGSRG